VLSLHTLRIQGNRNGNGPKTLELRDSRTGFDQLGVILPLTNAALTTLDFDTSSRALLQNMAPGTSVELRLYAYDAGSNPNGELFLDSVGGNSAISVNPVPEPATVLGLSAAGLGLAAAVRRRRERRNESMVRTAG
jgi:hypothetical protein